MASFESVVQPVVVVALHNCVALFAVELVVLVVLHKILEERPEVLHKILEEGPEVVADYKLAVDHFEQLALGRCHKRTGRGQKKAWHRNLWEELHSHFLL